MSDITDLRCTLNLFSSHNHTNERLPAHTHARINDFKSCKVKNNKSNTHTRTHTHTHAHLSDECSGKHVHPDPWGLGEKGWNK